MMWIVTFFSSWLCVVYFCAFIAFAMLSWFVCFGALGDKIFYKSRKVSYFLRTLLIVFFAAIGLYFLYASYQTLIFQHYVLSEKEPA